MRSPCNVRAELGAQVSILLIVLVYTLLNCRARHHSISANQFFQSLFQSVLPKVDSHHKSVSHPSFTNIS
jgi:hypothetical protein